METPNQRMKLTGVAILFFRASLILQTAPAAYPVLFDVRDRGVEQRQSFGVTPQSGISVAVHAAVNASLNGRQPQLLMDPWGDLTTVLPFPEIQGRLGCREAARFGRRSQARTGWISSLESHLQT